MLTIIVVGGIEVHTGMLVSGILVSENQTENKTEEMIGGLE